MNERDILNMIAELSAINNSLNILISEMQRNNFLLDEIYQELHK
jgi:hypothetical protein